MSINPLDQDALHGLVVVRRYMAGDNPSVLRRQAAEYWDAIRRGVDTGEHYTPQAMQAVLAAILQADREIEGPSKPTARALRAPSDVSVPPAVTPGGKLPPPATPSAKLIRPQKPVLSG
ncbi:MAG TPA: hypothetical protein VFP86_00310, partial [bacterium]|nr:hypothetical protein [bacterium]